MSYDYLNEIFRHADVMLNLKDSENLDPFQNGIPVMLEEALSKLIYPLKNPFSKYGSGLCHEVEWRFSDLYDYDMVQNGLEKLQNIAQDYGFIVSIRENVFYPHILYIRIFRPE